MYSRAPLVKPLLTIKLVAFARASPNALALFTSTFFLCLLHSILILCYEQVQKILYCLLG